MAVARRQQKPIFLSIGYASCHWCHVMAHESFEDPEIARLLNEHFVSIKVDRAGAARPGQDLHGGGAGDDRPRGLADVGVPDARGRAVFRRHVLAAAAAGRNARLRPGLAGGGRRLAAPPRPSCSDRPARSRRLLRATQVVGCVKRTETRLRGDCAVRFTHPTQEAEAALRRSFDPQRRRLRAGPEVPPAVGPAVAACSAGGDRATTELLRMVTTTLDRMAAGGIFDHLGGGFHRYTVDARWLVPHFEKMLYDNALLAVCYLEAWQATGQRALRRRGPADARLSAPRHDRSAGRLLQRRGRRQRRRGGQVLSLDARRNRGRARAGGRPDVLPRVRRDRGGQFRGPKHPPHCRGRWKSRPRCSAENPTSLAAELADARQKLLAVRSRRVRPGRDEKVLVWLEQPGHRRPGPRRRRAGRAAVHGRGRSAAADFLLAHVRSRRRAAACTAGGPARPSTTPISTTTPAWPTPC